MSNQTCTCRRLYPSGRAAKNLDPKCPVHGQRTPEGSVAHCPECNGGIAHNVFCSQKSAPKKPNDCTAPECKAERVSFSLFCAEHGRNTDDALRDVCRCGHVRRVHDTQFGCIASTDENEECDCGRFALAPADPCASPDKTSGAIQPLATAVSGSDRGAVAPQTSPRAEAPKSPGATSSGDSSSLEERARAFRDFNDGSGTVAMSTNDVERLAALLADVRREAIEDFLRGKK